MASAISRSTLIALLVAGAFFMENLDGTVIATALPQMATSFGIEAVDLNIGMTAYLLTLAVFIPISGWTADRVGPRTVFVTAIAVFTFASILCGLSDGLWTFTGSRVLQGIGGAMMVPVGRLVVLRNTEKRQLMRAIATITWPALVAPVLGPPVGGFLTTYASWRWIFYLNVPLGLLGAALALLLIPNRLGEARPPFDALGFVLTGFACAGLIYGLDLVGQPDLHWVPTILVIATSLGLGMAAVRHARRHQHPLLDLSGLKVPTFSVVIWGGSLFRIAISAIPFLMPLMFQLAFGLDAFTSGLLVLAVFAGNLAMKPGTSWVLRHFGFRTTLIANGLITAASTFACALLSPDTPVALIVTVLFVGGLSRSMQFTGLNTLGFADIPQPGMSGANTLASMVQQMSMGMGIAVGAIALRLASLLEPAAGDAPSLAAFHIAFVLVGFIALAAIFDCLGLAPDAGIEVSGHRRTTPTTG